MVSKMYTKYCYRMVNIKNNKGFSLVELIVTMAIFVLVIAITSDAFLIIQRHVSTQSRLAQSNIDGVIGLEILRSDLEAAGFGLFWNTPTDNNGNNINVTFLEADDNPPQNAYNSTSGAPRAVQSGDNVVLGDSSQQIDKTDYLVLRGTTLPHNAASQKWSYMTRQMAFATISSATPTSYPLRINTWSNNNFVAGDKVVVITGTDNKDPLYHRKLITKGSTTSDTTYFTQYSDSNLVDYQPPPPTTPPIPHGLTYDSSAYFIYGVDTNDGSTNADKLRMPYNRVDYYVRIPNAGVNKVPKRCAPNTGILFKSVVGHASGTQTEYPLLDCVADFQVVYTLDPENNDKPVTRSASGLRAPLSGTSDLTAEEIRNQLKNIQIYVLTHEGKKDTYYTYPKATIGVGPGNGETSATGSTFDLSAAEMKNYRWKVYRITIAPKNLLRSQK